MDRDKPTSLQGLLKFALQKTKSEDGTNSSEFKELDAESRQFIEAALRSMTIDVIEEFQKALSFLENPLASKDDILHALSTIRNHIDNLDFANDFIKVGGFTILILHLDHKDNEVRVNVINILAEMAQNNPFCQRHFLEANVLEKLIANSKEPEDVASSSLYAVSSIVRNYQPALVKFLSIGGINYLLGCLNTNHSRVFTKACFLIANLARESSDVRDEFIRKTAITKLFAHLDVVTGFDIRTETVLFALSELSNSEVWQPQKEQIEDIESVLTDIITCNSSLEQSEEITTYATIVLENLKRKTGTI